MPAFGPCRRACGCAGLFFCRRTPLSCLSSPHRSLPRLSSRLPSFFPSSVFLLPARISHCPHFPLPVSLSARVSLSPHLASFVRPSSFVCIPSGFSSVISCFSVHRPSLAACCPSLAACCPSLAACCPSPVVRRPLRRPSFIARRLLSVAHCPFLAARWPLLVAPSIVHRLPFVVRRPLSIPCCPLAVARCAVHRSSSIVHRPPLVGGCLYPVAAPRLFPLPFGPDHGFCIRGIPACVSAGAACRVVPQRVPSVGLSAKMRPPPPYLGRRAVSDKITPCILLSGAIFPARPAILLTIWQRLPFGTTFVQIQGVTGAPDPQGGRIPAARKENGKNINN